MSEGLPSTAAAEAVWQMHDEVRREVDKLRRHAYGLRDDLAKQGVELGLMRQDLAAIYGLLRLLLDRSGEPRSTAS